MKKAIFIFAAFLLASSLIGAGGSNKEALERFTASMAKDAEAEEGGEKGYEVLWVSDGDTFAVRYNGETAKVRLIGVDAPESCHATDPSRNTAWGKKASDYTKKRLSGQSVRLEFDKQKEDRYGRLLAYAYLGGRMYNKELVRKGYARAACYELNHRYKKAFAKLEKQAKKKKKGFWKDGYKAAFPG